MPTAKQQYRVIPLSNSGAKPSHGAHPLCAMELPNTRTALKAAQRLADKLAATSTARPGAVIIVTDEHGNEIGKAVVPSPSPIAGLN